MATTMKHLFDKCAIADTHNEMRSHAIAYGALIKNGAHNMDAETLRTGKKAELFVFRELISKGADVYLPMMDTGVDAVVRRKNSTYAEIQVKATEKDDQAGYFNVRDLQALTRPNYFVVCVDMNRAMAIEPGTPNVWIVPASEFMKYGQSGAKGQKKWGYRLAVYSRNRRHGNRRTGELIEAYRNNWASLTG